MDQTKVLQSDAERYLTVGQNDFLGQVSQLRGSSPVSVVGDGVRQLGFMERMKYAVASSFRDEVDGAVRERVKSVIAAVTTKLGSVSDDELRRIFLGNLSHLSSGQFERSMIPSNVMERLRAIVDTEASMSLAGPSVAPSKEYLEAVREVKLSLALDQWKKPIIPQSGTSLVGIFTDITGKPRLVVKPTGYGPASGWTRMSRIKKFFKETVCGTRPTTTINNELDSELTATHFARLLDVRSIAETHAVGLTANVGQRLFKGIGDNVEASAQLHVKSTLPEGSKYGMAKDLLGLSGWRARIKRILYSLVNYFTGDDHVRNFKQKEWVDRFCESVLGLRGLNLRDKLSEVQKFWVMDYLMGNLDRHEENWFLTYSAASKTLQGIIGIDQGACFYLRHPDNYFALRNQYGWKSLKEARLPFSPQTRILAAKAAVMQQNLVAAVHLNMKNKAEEDRNAIVTCLQERIQAIRGVADGSIKTPYDLAKIRESSDFSSK